MGPEANTQNKQQLAGKRLAAVFAHPDDESFGPGATFGLYSAAGVEMTLVCATLGEAGSIGDSKSYGPERLGRIRQAELEAAVEVLGFRALHLLGYADSGVSKVPMEQGVGDVLRILRAAEPDVVITFHPLGISGHLDHRTMTAFATAAVEQLNAEGRRIRLQYYTLPVSVTRHITYRVMPVVPDEDITVVLDTTDFAEVKRRAIHCHRTQLAFYPRLIEVPGADGRFAIERYVTHGAPRVATPARDIFFGMDGNPAHSCT